MAALHFMAAGRSQFPRLSVKRSKRSADRGFTLIELLVVVSIISVLVAISLPALSGARNEAYRLRTTAQLRDLMQSHFVWANAEDGTWAHFLKPGVQAVRVGDGQTEWYESRALAQSMLWVLAIAPHGFDHREQPPDHVTHPLLWRDHTERLSINPHGGGAYSYVYSAAMYTSPDLWDPDHPERRQQPDEWRRANRLSDVRHPSLKAVMFERANFHGDGLPIGGTDPVGTWICQTAFGDGHVKKVDAHSATAPLSVHFRPPAHSAEYFDRLPETLPLSNTPHGIRGQDL
ncbi:MAG: prepilin-type N-terminal cleavage/methylation domain-containing protein [Phycisphaerales bacterium]